MLLLFFFQYSLYLRYYSICSLWRCVFLPSGLMKKRNVLLHRSQKQHIGLYCFTHCLATPPNAHVSPALVTRTGSPSVGTKSRRVVLCKKCVELWAVSLLLWVCLLPCLRQEETRRPEDDSVPGDKRLASLVSLEEKQVETAGYLLLS